MYIFFWVLTFLVHAVLIHSLANKFITLEQLYNHWKARDNICNIPKEMFQYPHESIIYYYYYY